ncbi:hypothetical protein BDZ89DRAFT_1113403 [Hymenopellis radicata]|nr:hypothetical protein BDZ89DRAFT_1113403 [Hymenopellis radicata]
MSSPAQPTDSNASEEQQHRGWRFWLIFLSLCLSIFVAAIDIGSMGTALPSIVHDLKGTDSFAWVSAAYSLSTTYLLVLYANYLVITTSRSGTSHPAIPCIVVGQDMHRVTYHASSSRHNAPPPHQHAFHSLSSSYIPRIATQDITNPRRRIRAS